MLVEQIVHSSLNLVGGEAFSLLLKRPWNPVVGVTPMDRQVSHVQPLIKVSGRNLILHYLMRTPGLSNTADGKTELLRVFDTNCRIMLYVEPVGLLSQDFRLSTDETDHAMGPGSLANLSFGMHDIRTKEGCSTARVDLHVLFISRIHYLWYAFTTTVSFVMHGFFC